MKKSNNNLFKALTIIRDILVIIAVIAVLVFLQIFLTMMFMYT